MACCGRSGSDEADAAGDDEGSKALGCCGEPDRLQAPCRWCEGSGRASEEAIFAYAAHTGDFALCAEHQAALMLDGLFLGHRARRRRL